jgi:hypothetical protein
VHFNASYSIESNDAQIRHAAASACPTGAGTEHLQLPKNFVVEVASISFVILLYSVSFDGSLVDLVLSIRILRSTHGVPNGSCAADTLCTIEQLTSETFMLQPMTYYA